MLPGITVGFPLLPAACAVVLRGKGVVVFFWFWLESAFVVVVVAWMTDLISAT